MKRVFYLHVAAAVVIQMGLIAAPIEAYANYAGIPIGDPVTPGSNAEFGDEVTLTTGTSILDTVAIGYRYTRPLGQGPGTATLRIWDKAGSLPGNLLWESAPVLLDSGSRGGAMFQNIRIAVPATFVWTVDFNNVSDVDRAGLLYGTGAEVGSGPGQSEDFLWQNVGTAAAPNWQQFIDPARTDNAWNWVTVIPEPSTTALICVGITLSAAVARTRRLA